MIKKWEEETDRKRGKCAEILCRNNATDGAVVQVVGDKSGQKYIIPLCEDHNRGDMRGKEFDVDTISYPLVPVSDDEVMKDK